MSGIDPSSHLSQRRHPASKMAVPVQPYADLEPDPMPIGDDKDEKERASSLTEYVPLGREELSDKIPPNDSYEGELGRWVN
jgi:hypothetical protein